LIIQHRNYPLLTIIVIEQTTRGSQAKIGSLFASSEGGERDHKIGIVDQISVSNNKPDVVGL
jgi:hypothetical protein